MCRFRVFSQYIDSGQKSLQAYGGDGKVSDLYDFQTDVFKVEGEMS